MNSYNKSVTIDGNLEGSVVVTGDNDAVTVQFKKVILPPSDSVDISAELVKVRQLLAALPVTDKEAQKINNALNEADMEAKETTPDRDEVGAAIDRALKYAQKAEGFADTINKLKPHVKNIAGWLGANWHKLVGLVGLSV